MNRRHRRGTPSFRSQPITPDGRATGARAGLASLGSLAEEKVRYRILMLAPTGFFSDYGCHVRILEEASILRQKGHRPVILTYRHGRNWPGLDIVRIPSLPCDNRYEMGSSWYKLIFDPLLLLRSLITFRGRRPDVIHAFLHEGAWVGYILSRLWHVPLIFDYQGSLTGEMIDHGFLSRESYLHRFLKRVEVFINNLPEAIITSSAHAAHLLRHHFACRCPLIVTAPDGADFRRFHRFPQESLQEIRTALDLPKRKHIIAYLGKLAHYQGTDFLLEAASQLCARRDDVHFLIMGYPNVEKYRQKAAMLGIADRVTLTGRIPYEEAARYLSLASIAVAPKLSETESNGKLLNYMAIGLPTVSYDTPVAREYLGKWGQYAVRHDASSLSDAIETLLSRENEWEHLGAQLRRRAVESYSWDRSGELIEQVYHFTLRKTLTQPDYFANYQKISESGSFPTDEYVDLLSAENKYIV